MAGERQRGDAANHGVTACVRCGCDTLRPLACAPADSGRWALTVQCPNCFLVADRALDDAALDAFEDHMERGTDALVDTLRTLSHANMIEDVELLIRALRADALLPMDFDF